MEWLNADAWPRTRVLVSSDAKRFFMSGAVQRGAFAAACLEVVEGVGSSASHVIQQVEVLQLLLEAARSLLPSPTDLAGAITRLTRVVVLEDSRQHNAMVAHQLLVTTTGLMILADQPRTNPEDFVKFVDLALLTPLSKTNSASHPLRRHAACMCLVEIEQAYPGILATKLGQLLRLAQEETSALEQSYLHLVTVVYEHAVQQLRLHAAVRQSNGEQDQPLQQPLHSNLSIDSILTQTEPLKPLYLPSELRNTKTPAKCLLHGLPTVNQDTAQALRRPLAYVVERINHLSSSMLGLALPRLAGVVLGTDITPRAFRTAFPRFLQTSSPVTVNAALHLLQCFGFGLLHPRDQRALFLKAAAAINSRWASTCEKQAVLAALSWSTFSFDLGTLWARLVPVALEPSRLHASRCACVAALLSKLWGSSPAHALVQGSLEEASLLERSFAEDMSLYSFRDNGPDLALNGGALSPQQASAAVLRLLECFSEFEIVGPKTGVAADLLRTLLQLLVAHRDTLLHTDLRDFVLRTAARHAVFVPSFVTLLGFVYHAGSPDLDLCLGSIESEFSRQTTSWLSSNVNEYLALLERVAQQQGVHPGPYLSQLLAVLQETSVGTHATWAQGCRLLAICRNVMVTHDTWMVMQSLGSVLDHLRRHEVDVDTRDYASVLYRLLAHVRGSDLDSIITFDTNMLKGEGGAATLQQLLPDLSHPVFTQTADGADEAAEDDVMARPFSSAPAPQRTYIRMPNLTVQLRSSASKLQVEPVTVTKETPAEPLSLDVESVLGHYQAVLATKNSAVHVACRLALSRGADNSPTELLGLCLHCPAGESFLVDDVVLPWLSLDGTEREASSHFELIIRPSKLITQLSVCLQASFSTTAPQNFDTVLSPLSIPFYRLLVKPPFTLESAAAADHEQESEAWGTFFEAMWKAIESDTAKGFVGVKYVENADAVASALEPFRIPEQSPAGQGWRAACLLLPSSHVLFRACTRNAGLKVDFACSDMALVPSIDTLLEEDAK